MLKNEDALNLASAFKFIYELSLTEDYKNRDFTCELVTLKALIDEKEGREVKLEEIIN